MELGQMLMIAGFDRAEHMYRRNIGTGEGAIVHHLLHARASGGDLRCEIGHATASVVNCRAHFVSGP